MNPKNFSFSFTDTQFAYAIIVPILLIEAALTGYPILYSLYISLGEVDPATGAVKLVGFTNYLSALKDPVVHESILRTFYFCSIATIGAVSLSLFLALIMNENFTGRRVFRVIVLLPWATSEFVSSLIWRTILSETYGVLNSILLSLKLINTYKVWLTEKYAMLWVVVVWLWHFAPLGAFFILSALQSIPQELYNAAKVDGAGVWKRFRNVTLPYIKYSLLIVLVLSTMEAFRAFDVFYALTGGGPGMSTEVLTFQIYRLQFQQLNFGYASAISYILLLISFALAMMYFVLLTRRRR